jgi:uncharacterized membrane protein YhaH (DUF805 family)
VVGFSGPPHSIEKALAPLPDQRWQDARQWQEAAFSAQAPAREIPRAEVAPASIWDDGDTINATLAKADHAKPARKISKSTRNNLIPVSYREMLFSYNARVGCLQFWFLVVFVGLILPFIVIYITAGSESQMYVIIALLFSFFWSLFVGVPNTVKRFHDHGLTGKWMLTLLILFISGFVNYIHFPLVVIFGFVVIFGLLILLGIIPGKNIPNKYGPPISQLSFPL